MQTFELGDSENIPYGTKVSFTLANGTDPMKGVIVGKTGTDLMHQHIVRVTDGSIPHKDYPYDTVVVALPWITILD